ncbi:MAG: amidase family protein [Dehalococcoidia bacterium]|nr:amidase family protein [Dehalococcoidia bacterium]MDD5494740.1 amidase family protein [Dehalococcoidia bacterium]
MSDNEICRMTVMEMAQAIRDRTLSPVEVMDAVLRRIEKLNPTVNAFCTLVTERARKEAKEAENKVKSGDKLGLLHGVPVSIKDLLFTEGIRTTGGSKIFEHYVPQESDIAVKRLEGAGAIVIGKTNTSEFGWMALTDNRLFGPTHNPWNLELTPGGSSGGAAAAVASGMGPLAIGTDGGGSIRVPASFCGVFGYKPSFGRVPRGPSLPGLEMLAHTGPITRTVGDAALAMEIIAGRDDIDCFSLPETNLSYLPALSGDLKGLKIAWSPDLGYLVADPQVLKITEAAAKTFSGLGANIELIKPDFSCPEQAFSTHFGVQLSTLLYNKLGEYRQQLDPLLAVFIDISKDKSARECIEAWWELLEYRKRMSAIFDKYDLLLTPTVTVPPFKLGNYGPREIAGKKVSPLAWMAFTYPFNITGQPAASVPCGWTDDNLPIGLQIVGRRFDDTTVLKASAAFETASPWAHKYPPVF